MFATSLALLAQEFEGERRGFAFGVWGAVSGAAIALGPLVGGALVDAIDWEWIFFVNIPIAAVLIVLTLTRVPESKAGRAEPLDLPGAVTFAAALTAARPRPDARQQRGLGRPDDRRRRWWAARSCCSCSSRSSFAAPRPCSTCASSATARSRGRPPSRSSSRSRSTRCSSSSSLWLQDILGYGPFETGLRLLPFTLALFVVAPVAGKLTARRPLGELLGAGLVLLTVGPPDDARARRRLRLGGRAARPARERRRRRPDQPGARGGDGERAADRAERPRLRASTTRFARPGSPRASPAWGRSSSAMTRMRPDLRPV